VKPYIEQSKYTYPVGLDPKMEVAQLYGARSVPSTFIIDRSGTLRAIALGPRDWDGKAAFAYIEALLKDGKPRG
jgi:alkyl hydroperoxide reductase subunit AhpC